MTQFLQLEDLSISYNGCKVVSCLSGRFSSGTVNLIVGRAGTGKSSLLLAIAGFHKEISGQISDESGIFKHSGNFSLAFQNPESLFFNSSVGDEVEFALRMRETPETEITGRSRNWLARWGLDPDLFYDRHPLELSGGEKRRVALAACTVFLPPVILLDEPLAGLDRNGQKALADMLSIMAVEHIVIVVTHEPEIFLQSSANLLFLREGSGSWFTGADFISNALQDNSFYPLPAWYQQAVAPYKNHPGLPAINAAEVIEFLKKEGNYADRL